MIGLKYYIFGFTNGNPAVLGGYDTEMEAYEIAMSTNFDNGQFEIKRDTANKPEAIRRWKEQQNRKTGRIDLSLRPVKHLEG